MNKMLTFLFLLVFVLSIVPTNLSATVLIEDDFDAWPDTVSDQHPPEPWCQDCGTTGTAAPLNIGGVSHSSVEVNGLGRGDTGKSLKSWRNGDSWGHDYFPPMLGLRPSAGGVPEGTHSSLYMRFSMKVPTAFVFPNNGDYVKFLRFNLSNGDEFPINFNDGNIQVCPGGGGYDCWFYSEPEITDICGGASNWHDGQWHTHQLYVNLQTRTVTWWLDGVQTYSKSNMDFNGIPTTSKFGDNGDFIQGFPTGNRSTGSVFQTGWQSFEIDDIMIATTKAETDMGGEDDTTNPVVTITGPTSSATHATSSASGSYSGSCTDAGGVASVTWACPTCTPTSGTATDTTSWSFSNTLASGANTITVTCTDTSSNTHQDSLVDTYTPGATGSAQLGSGGASIGSGGGRFN